MNDVWTEVLGLLGVLNGENVKRRDYVTTPEFLEDFGKWKNKYEGYINTLLY